MNASVRRETLSILATSDQVQLAFKYGPECFTILRVNGYYGAAQTVAVPPADTVAVFKLAQTVEKIDSSELPIAVRAKIAATDTSAAIRPYSIAVAPDSSAIRLRNLEVNIVLSSEMMVASGTMMAPVS